MIGSHWVKSIGVALLVVLTSAASAQTPPDNTLPPALKDWRAWVLKDQDYRACPFVGNQLPNSPGHFLCAWPSRMTINAGNDGATFALRWQVDAPTWLELPGDATQWPQQVTVNHQRQPVVNRGGSPFLRMANTGTFDVAGQLSWRERPQSLHVPAEVGLIALTIDGKPVTPLQRDGQTVTLGRASTATPETDAMQIRVFRKLSDGQPSQLQTQIQIFSSGHAREEVLGPVLPEGFAPMSLTSEWPARLDDDGRLHVQVRAGDDTLTIDARATAPLTSVKARMPGAPWPGQETWSYEADTQLRVTTASSPLQVDPRQAGVPADWSALPAFALGNDGVLAIEQRSRGMNVDEGNRLSLRREAWLSFDGENWFARDRVVGKMVRAWRLDVAAPYVLERADASNSPRGINGGAEPLLITKGANPTLTGVEWRTPAVDLAAGVRVVGASASLPVSGWQDTFDQINTTLHLPYGYRLLGAPGADAATGSWMSNWTLLDAFVCAIAVLLAWRLLGLTAAVVSVLYLALAYQEGGSPFWTLLGVAALALIVRALPQGRLRVWANSVRRVVLLLLILAGLAFMAAQLRLALYPQLENEAFVTATLGESIADKVWDFETANDVEGQTRAALAPPPPASAPVPKQMQEKSKLETIVVTGSNIQRADVIDHYAQSTVVQTGAGEPSWDLGSTAQLSWSGPVTVGQSVHLLIAPPWLVRILRVLMVAALAWLIWRLSSGLATSGNASPSAGAAAFLVIGLITSVPAQSQNLPSPELLQELRARLTAAPPCAPTCAAIGEALVSATGDSIGVVLDAQAIENVAIPLPLADASTTLNSIKVDGVANEAVRRQPDGTLWLQIARGVHRVELQLGAYSDKVSLSFPLVPGRIQVNADGWESSGVNESRLMAETLNLTRARSNASEKISSGAQQFAPYVRVYRNLTLGLRWDLSTQVVRLAPAHGGMTVSVPAWRGEHVTSPEVTAEGGNVIAAFGDETSTVAWSGELDKGDSFSITAPPLSERAEVWRIVVSPMWHAEFSGVPEASDHDYDDATDYRNFEFDPLPGETLTVTITRPVAAQGETRALDSVNMFTSQGQHASTSTLRLDTRASQGGEQAIDLPKDAEVLGVLRDGQPLNLRPHDGKLTLPLVPGAHHFDISFRQPAELSAVTRTPDIALGLSAANVELAVNLPEDRWLLATWGPRVGPAVLYWGELLVMIAIAYVLSRTRRTRLRFIDWLLLGFGFSTFSWGALVVVVAWLFAFDWRSRTTLTTTRAFNLAQVGLAALTLVALICLMSAIPQGLLGQPDMHVSGYHSSAHALHWFVDRTGNAWPQASAVSLPMWVYKVLMLLWALWLANALIAWLRQAFAAWTRDGYWHARVKTPPQTPPPVEAP